MEKLKNRPCGNCGANAIEQVNLKGTWFNEPWKDFPKVFITHDINHLQCRECGEFAGTRSIAKAFDEAVRHSIKDQVSHFITAIKQRTKLPFTEIAERIPMGYQHLSDLKNKRSFPSYHYWALLYSIYRDPDLLDRLDPRSEDAPVSNFG